MDTASPEKTPPPPLTPIQAGYIADLMEKYGGEPVLRILMTKFHSLYMACVYAGMDDDDIRQSGMIGLMRAARLYDPDYRTRFGKRQPTFGTFAVNWMRYEIQKQLRQHRGTPPNVIPPPHVTIFGPAGDTLADPDDGGEAEESQQDACRQVALLLRYLPEREKSVLMMRYGLLGCRPMTLQEIGDWFGQTKERPRQIQASALSRLRRMVRVG